MTFSGLENRKYRVEFKLPKLRKKINDRSFTAFVRFHALTCFKSLRVLKERHKDIHLRFLQPTRPGHLLRR